MDLQSYRHINESFDKTLVFHLGSRAGFFSEYNTMIQAMIYCLRHRIRFEMYSGDANFRMRCGWRDYFEPFCPEQTSPLHRVFNYRFPRPGVKFALRKHLGRPLLRILCQCDYLTYDLWNDFRRQVAGEPLDIPALGWQGSFRQCCREVVEMTWRFVPEAAEAVGVEMRRIGLPPDYVGVHIRGGDKIKEYHGSPPSAYIEKLQSATNSRDVLVMTDDYRIFERLCADYPGWRFFTLESPAQQGYQHRACKRKTAAQKRQDYIRLFAGVELMAAAQHVVGTFSSNIGVFFGMRTPPDRCHAVDADAWKML